jgi:hypothetical protein
LARSRAPERLPKKGFALFEAKPSLQSPGSIEERRDSRQRRDKGHRVPFLWFVSLGKQRNEQMNKSFLRLPRVLGNKKKRLEHSKWRNHGE